MYLFQVNGDIDKIHNVLSNVDKSDLISFKEVLRGQFSVVYNDSSFEFMNSIKETNHPYFFEIEYKDTDYDNEEYNKSMKDSRYQSDLFACSSIRIGNFYGRNLDWYATNGVDVLIRVKSTGKTKHSSIGVATSTDITREMILKKTPSKLLKLLPFRTMDGINDAGVAINTNVVPLGDKLKNQETENHTIGTNPGKEDLFISAAVRYVLDMADSVDDAIELLRNKNMYGVKDKECHLMISDMTKTVIVEFIGNEMNVIECSTDGSSLPAIMTNFYVTGWNRDTTDIVVEDNFGGVNPTLTDHAAGLERYKILYDGKNDVTDMKSMAKLMKSVWYSNAYKEETSPRWYSEFAADYRYMGYPDVTLYMSNENGEQKGWFDFAFQVSKGMYDEAKDKNNGTIWITTHTTVYDLEKKELLVIPRESTNGFDVMKYSL